MLKKNKIKDFFDGMFGQKAKDKKLMKQLKKLKTRFLQLEEKYDTSKITKKELDEYYKLKEEIKKMAEKFTIDVDGKLVPKSEVVTPKEEVQEQVKEKAAVTRVKEEVDSKETDEELRQRYEHEQEMLREQAYRMEMQRRQQQAQQQQQNQRPPQSQQRPQPPSLPDAVIAYVSVQDLQELFVRIKTSDIEKFETEINTAIAEGKVFYFGPYVLNASKILMYRYGKVDDLQNN